MTRDKNASDFASSSVTGIAPGSGSKHSPKSGTKSSRPGTKHLNPQELAGRAQGTGGGEPDTRDVGLQLAGTERALQATVGANKRLRGELAASRGEAEGLRMTLASIRALLEEAKC